MIVNAVEEDSVIIKKLKFWGVFLLILCVDLPQAAQLSIFYLGKSEMLHLHEGPD